MRSFIDNQIHDISEIGDALAEYPLIRVKNDMDRMRLDIDVWDKIAEKKGISAQRFSASLESNQDGLS